MLWAEGWAGRVAGLRREVAISHLGLRTAGPGKRTAVKWSPEVDAELLHIMLVQSCILRIEVRTGFYWPYPHSIAYLSGLLRAPRRDI